MSVLNPPVSLPPSLVPASGPMTVAEFRARYANRYAGLVRGFPKELPVPKPPHGKVCATIVGHLYMWNHSRKVGHIISHDSWVSVAPDTIRGPDVMFVSFTRLPRGPLPDTELTVAPELVFEVKSPSDAWTEIFAKVEEYLAAGTTAVVVVDPERRTASVCRQGPTQTDLTDADTLTVEDVLPGFAVPVAELFA